MSIIEFRPTSGVTGHFSVEMKFRGASKFTARRSARQVVTGDTFSLNFGSDQVEQSNFVHKYVTTFKVKSAVT